MPDASDKDLINHATRAQLTLPTLPPVPSLPATSPSPIHASPTTSVADPTSTDNRPATLAALLAEAFSDIEGLQKELATAKSTLASSQSALALSNESLEALRKGELGTLASIAEYRKTADSAAEGRKHAEARLEQVERVLKGLGVVSRAMRDGSGGRELVVEGQEERDVNAMDLDADETPLDLEKISSIVGNTPLPRAVSAFFLRIDARRAAAETSLHTASADLSSVQSVLQETEMALGKAHKEFQNSQVVLAQTQSQLKDTQVQLQAAEIARDENLGRLATIQGGWERLNGYLQEVSSRVTDSCAGFTKIVGEVGGRVVVVSSSAFEASSAHPPYLPSSSPYDFDRRMMPPTAQAGSRRPREDNLDFGAYPPPKRARAEDGEYHHHSTPVYNPSSRFHPSSVAPSSHHNVRRGSVERQPTLVHRSPTHRDSRELNMDRASLPSAPAPHSGKQGRSSSSASDDVDQMLYDTAAAASAPKERSSMEALRGAVDVVERGPERGGTLTHIPTKGKSLHSTSSAAAASAAPTVAQTSSRPHLYPAVNAENQRISPVRTAWAIQGWEVRREVGTRSLGPGTVCDRCRKKMKRVERRGTLEAAQAQAAAAAAVPIASSGPTHGMSENDPDYTPSKVAKPHVHVSPTYHEHRASPPRSAAR
ncbi:unnamed protein product [Mycena citricolor]|uniref:Uncharacterized protein n=1 Tax=Mycena citricolor TaxID=2018698 RepID=A0AAD2Q3B1_9AGAR|nr:unnamed protein product [Mycena citricolor]